MTQPDAHPGKNLGPLTPMDLALGIERFMDRGRIGKSGVLEAITILGQRGKIPMLMETSTQPVIERDGFILNHEDGKFFSPVTGKNGNFTVAERRIAYQLMVHPGILSREQLLSLCDFDFDVDERNIDVHINAIRQKADKRPPELFRTSYGAGYYFRRKIIAEGS